MIEDKSLLKIDELYEKYNLECSRKAIFNEISKDKDKRKSFFYRNIFRFVVEPIFYIFFGIFTYII